MIKKILKYSGLTLLILFIIFVIYYSPSYVFRVFAWQDADYDDFSRFKLAPINKAENTFYFSKGSTLDQKKVKMKFITLTKTVKI